MPIYGIISMNIFYTWVARMIQIIAITMIGTCFTITVFVILIDTI